MQTHAHKPSANLTDGMNVLPIYIQAEKLISVRKKEKFGERNCHPFFPSIMQQTFIEIFK